MTDYEKVMLYLRTRCYETRAEWSGDEPGEKEDKPTEEQVSEWLEKEHYITFKPDYERMRITEVTV